MEKANKSGAGVSHAPRTLTHRLLESLKPWATPYRLPDALTRGLAARVATDGRISWDCSFRISGAGKVRRASLGAWPGDATLEQARDRANELTKAARAGRDLLAEETVARRESAARTTVGAMIDEYVKRRVHGQLKTAHEIERRLKRALASLLGRPAADVRRRDIRVVLDTVADAGFAREAEKRRQCIGAMWKWAIEADIVETNAAANLPRYNGGTPRDRVLTPDEIATFWHWLPGSRIPAAHADVLRLQLLLGARSGEIAGMQVDEIDLPRRIWTLPAERSKNGNARATPLVGRAWEIVSRWLACTTQGPVFATDSHKSLTASHVGQMLLTRPLPIAKFVTHDLRRTVASGLVDLGISMEITAAVLGHAVGGAKLATLRRHYVRTDYIEPKRRALEAWSLRIEGLISGSTQPASIVQFTPPRAEGREATA